MTSAFVVVIVPDFSCAEAARFEARTLLFLASWLANATIDACALGNTLQSCYKRDVAGALANDAKNRACAYV